MERLKDIEKLSEHFSGEKKKIDNVKLESNIGSFMKLLVNK